MRLFCICLVIGCFVLVSSLRDQRAHSTEIHAPKGRFMVHMLHSAYFFKNTVNVKWTATAKGKPDLPLWLHLFPSRHRGISYLVGTPVTPLQQVTVHVIARSLDTYEKADQYVTFILGDDARFNTTTQQIVELRIKNVEAEDFINLRNDQLKRLERTIHETFRGKGVNPYVYNIFPEYIPDPQEEVTYYRPPIKSGSVVQIGTQAHFHPNVLNLVNGLRSNPDYCSQSAIIPLNKHFRNIFEIDWCQFSVKNVTLLKGFIQSPSTTSTPSISSQNENAGIPVEVDKMNGQEKKLNEKQIDAERIYDFSHPNDFWTNYLIILFLAAFIICLVLILCYIFFGRREGQQWRDYKTPKEQLHEYLNVRESQRHLRELSVQRQILLMDGDRSKSTTPLGVQAFLQPRGSSQTPATQKRNPISSSQPRLQPSTPTAFRNEPRAASTKPEDGNNERFPLITPRSSVGKQTVGEAAIATGSSLNLYRNPLIEDEADERVNYR
ncbi:Epsilon-sarcoglycan [Aphelenchoides besseyi]|nr:Epsilon-sarcoglycan [Aphelenchoides besseyi]